jgi:hypothetical protein
MVTHLDVFVHHFYAGMQNITLIAFSDTATGFPQGSRPACMQASLYNNFIKCCLLRCLTYIERAYPPEVD